MSRRHYKLNPRGLPGGGFRNINSWKFPGLPDCMGEHSDCNRLPPGPVTVEFQNAREKHHTTFREEKSGLYRKGGGAQNRTGFSSNIPGN